MSFQRESTPITVSLDEKGNPVEFILGGNTHEIDSVTRKLRDVRRDWKGRVDKTTYGVRTADGELEIEVNNLDGSVKITMKFR